MKITDIKQQIKRQDRYSIFVDGKYCFSLSENELMKSGIKVGREYSETELDQLKKTAVLDKAYMRSLDLLSRRARSKWEIEQYLKRKDYTAEVTAEITKLLEDKGYINDYEFAKSWVENRRLLKATSRKKLRLELKQKRIEESIVEKVINDDQSDEIEIIKQIIESKRRQSRYQDEQKLIAYLLRQGFNYGDIKECL